MDLAEMVEELDEWGDDLKLTEWERKFIGDMMDRLVRADYDNEIFETNLSVKEEAIINQIYEERA